MPKMMAFHATISGTPRVGQTLTASNGTFTGDQPITYTYQWQRCDQNGSNCSNIVGATGQTYVLTSADQARTVSVNGAAGSIAGQSPRSPSVGQLETTKILIVANAVSRQGFREKRLFRPIRPRKARQDNRYKSSILRNRSNPYLWQNFTTDPGR